MTINFEGIDPEHITRFNELLVFNAESHLLDLIKDSARQAETKYNWLFKAISSIYHKNEGERVPKEAEKLLKKKFKYWNDYLIDQLLDSRDNQLKLRSLAKFIFDSKKTQWIRKKLKQMHFKSRKLIHVINLFEKHIIRIISQSNTNEEPRQFQIDYKPLRHLDLVGYFYYSGFSALQGYSKTSDLFVSRIQIPYAAKIQEEQAMAKSRLLELEHSMHHFCTYLPKYDPDWKLNLAIRFGALATDEEIQIASSLLTDIQALEIFHMASGEKSFQNKIPLMLISLKFQTLISVMIGLDSDTIRKLRKGFENHPAVDQEWYLDAFAIVRQEFATLCNDSKTKIDELNAKLRINVQHLDYLNSSEELNSDLQRISDVREEIGLRCEATKKFFTLIEDVFMDSTTTQLRFQLDNNYRNELGRCTEIPDEEMMMKDSCPFGIIHGRIFADNGCSDDQGPLDIFGAWNLFFITDYQQVGLLPNVTQEKFEDWSKDSTKGNFYTAYNLHKLGINTIHDLKRTKIFNQHLLQDYVTKPENREILCKPQNLLIDLFAEWGIIYIKDYLTLGLLKNSTADKLIEISKSFELKCEYILNRLKDIGIESIDDLKVLDISNRNQLYRHFTRSSRE